MRKLQWYNQTTKVARMNMPSIWVYEQVQVQICFQLLYVRRSIKSEAKYFINYFDIQLLVDVHRHCYKPTAQKSTHSHQYK